jgi:eukaryotic-like serine/threonine-protein kinase
MDMSFDEPAGGAPKRARSGNPPRLPTGTTLNDRYQIDEFLGAHAYGETYRARDLADGRLVTIKALTPALLADAQVRQRLEREIQVAVQLEHKNVASTYGLFGAMVGSDAVAYLAAEYVDGQSLRDMIEKKRAAGRTFSLKGTYNVVAHLCNALIYAHGATVHGGLTPDAVMVNSAGRVKVCDFGLARTLRPLDHFQAQAAAGDLASLPPEMVSQPDQADARADVYSVGVILFELLTGKPPSESFEPPSKGVQGVPPAVDQVVQKCLQPMPNQRFADAHALKDALHAALGNELEGGSGKMDGPATAPGKSMAPPPPKPPAPPSPPPAPTRSAAPPPPARTPTPPAQPAVKPPPQQAQAPIAKSFNVDAALSAVDDQTERWLIQKDKLDFGPFNMREIRSQVEAGKIAGEHTIVDTETGERRRVKDHPQLRQLVMEAESRLAEKSRMDAEDADRRKQRGKVVTLLGIIFVVVLAVGGGVTWYVMHMQPKVVEKIVHDKNDDLDFLKGLEISMKVDPPVAKPKGHKRKPGSKNEFSDVTSLGDASEDGGDETLDQTVVQKVMTANFKVLLGCIAEERRRNSSLSTVDMDFIIKGTGNVSAVKVNGQTGSPLAGCMYGKMQTVAFPKFNGAKTHASFTLNLKH